MLILIYSAASRKRFFSLAELILKHLKAAHQPVPLAAIIPAPGRREALGPAAAAGIWQLGYPWLAKGVPTSLDLTIIANLFNLLCKHITP
jgi:hypothetical protein